MYECICTMHSVLDFRIIMNTYHNLKYTSCHFYPFSSIYSFVWSIKINQFCFSYKFLLDRYFSASRKCMVILCLMWHKQLQYSLRAHKRKKNQIMSFYLILLRFLFMVNYNWSKYCLEIIYMLFVYVSSYIVNSTHYASIRYLNNNKSNCT